VEAAEVPPDDPVDLAARGVADAEAPERGVNEAGVAWDDRWAWRAEARDGAGAKLGGVTPDAAGANEVTGVDGADCVRENGDPSATLGADSADGRRREPAGMKLGGTP